VAGIPEIVNSLCRRINILQKIQTGDCEAGSRLNRQRATGTLQLATCHSPAQLPARRRDVLTLAFPDHRCQVMLYKDFLKPENPFR
jgi:hypothetical protein